MSLMRAWQRFAIYVASIVIWRCTSAAAVVIRGGRSETTLLKAKSISSAVIGKAEEIYSTNAICTRKNCINPIFPGLEDLQRLQGATWKAASLRDGIEQMNFCRHAVNYDFAVPSPDNGTANLRDMVTRQDQAAATQYYYHLAGLGLDSWDYQRPWLANDCVKSVWNMVCFTYFPRHKVGLKDGDSQPYVRPCQSSCQNYIRACGVECCDESVKCVFTHVKNISVTDGGVHRLQTVTSQGYSPHDAPSSMCTGGTSRTASPCGAVLMFLMMLLSSGLSLNSASARGKTGDFVNRRLLLLVAFAAMMTPGFAIDVPIHRVGNWRAEPDYLLQSAFIPPGGQVSGEKTQDINSCSNPRLAPTLVCSGRGTCRKWDVGNMNNTLGFCECDRDWADAECRTRRKSQAKAYFLSMFFGFLGADQFYLGHIGNGLLKLFTLGGFGTLWISDMIAIGSAPVLTNHFATAADLPHAAFVLTIVLLAMVLGFVAAYHITTRDRFRKRSEAMLLGLDEERFGCQAFNNTLNKPLADAYKPNGKPQMKRERFDLLGPLSMEPRGPMGSMFPPLHGPMLPMPGMHPMGPPRPPMPPMRGGMNFY